MVNLPSLIKFVKERVDNCVGFPNGFTTEKTFQYLYELRGEQAFSHCRQVLESLSTQRCYTHDTLINILEEELCQTEWMQTTTMPWIQKNRA